MRSFVVYTLARLLLFAGCFAVVWAVCFHWLPWNQITILGTALVALAMSGVSSFWLLARFRDDLARDVEARAHRIAERIDRSRRAEDEV